MLESAVLGGGTVAQQLVVRNIVAEGGNGARSEAGEAGEFELEHDLVAVLYRGFLGLLVAMLVNYQPLVAVPVSLFFAMLNIGSIQLPIVMKLDSTLSGVLQGALVLFVLLVDGARKVLLKKS